MKELFDAIPEPVAPELKLDRHHERSEVLPPDDDDVIRPDAEQELLGLGEEGSLVHAGPTPLSKHLLWTFGPVHRDFPVMIQLRTELEGDRLVTVDPEIGWLHQGLEKAMEGNSVERALRVAERLRPAAPAAHQLGFVLAIERLLGVEDKVAERAQLWRVVACEITRIREHLEVLSSLVAAHSDRRAQAAFLEAARAVRTVLELATFRDGVPLCPAIGGLSDEVPDGVVEALERSLPDALSPVRAAGDRLWQNPAFIDSLSGRGAIDRQSAVDLGLTGPLLRATGAADDVRTQDPYFAYGRIKPRVPTETSGDALARFAVRLDEVAASSASVLRALASFGSAPGSAAAPPDVVERDESGAIVIPTGMSAASTEVASGELSWIIDADERAGLLRVRVKGPSFSLASALPTLLYRARLDDVVPVMRSLGLQDGELDR